MESQTFGISLQSGKVLYECSLKTCTNHSETSVKDSDVIVIQRQSQTVRAIEPRSGLEKWNFSVGQHDLKLFSECHGNSEPEWDYGFQIVVPEGVIYSLYHDNSAVIWKHKFDSPIVNVWRFKNGVLDEVDLFNDWRKPSITINAPPSVYIGMHNHQLYIQESAKLENKRREYATKYRYNLLPDKSNFPRIPWQPLPVSSTALGFVSNKEFGLSDDNPLQTTALSVLYASSYVNGNGFYLHTEDEIKKSQNAKCETIQNGNFSADSNNESKDGDMEGFEHAESDTPVQIVIVSLWYWWREVLVISLTTAIVFNFMFVRKFPNILRSKRGEIHLKKLDPSTEKVSDSGIGLTGKERSRNNSENHSSIFVSRYLTDFDPIQCLGKGGFGVVFEAKNKIDECNYAIKRIMLPNKQESRDRVMREVKALAKLDHYHIVRYFNAWLEYPPPGWQEERDKLWTCSPCYSELVSSDEPRSTSPVINQKDRSNLIDKNTAFFHLNSKHCENHIVSDPNLSQENSDPSLNFKQLKNNKRHEKSDSFIVFESSSSKDCNNDSIVKKEHSVITLSSESDDGGCFSDIPQERESTAEVLSVINSSKVYLFIQMQLCQRLSLREWLQENTNRNYRYVLQLFDQIVQAVEYVHMQGLIHRDLKPSNIFFSLDGQIKVGDFGLVTTITEGNEMNLSHSDEGRFQSEKHTAKVGTQLYMSPEQLMGKPYTYKVDIYSLGLILFELLISFSTQMERTQTLERLRKHIFPESFQEKHPNEYELLKLMLSNKPEERPTTYGIRVKEPLRQMANETDLLSIDLDWHFELPSKRRESSKSSLSSISSNELPESR